MRKFCTTINLLLVAAGVLHAQSDEVEVLVVSRTQPAAASSAASVAVDVMEIGLRKELLRLFPCVSVTFASAIKTSLEFQKQRQLLNADFDSGIDAMAGALGANYVFSFTVTDMPDGQLAMKGSLINAATSKVLSTRSSLASVDKAIKGGEAAWLARQLVPGLNGISRLTKDKCVPTNRWTGTVTYHAAEHRQESEKTPASEGEGSTTNTITTDIMYDATMRIGWTGDPKVHATASDVRRTDQVVISPYVCDAGTYGNSGKSRRVSMGGVYNTVIESRADTNTSGSLQVEVAHGRIELRFNVTSLDGTTKTTDSKKYDGGCDKPTSSTQKFEAEWNHPSVHVKVEQTAERFDDEQSGSYKGPDGETLTWRLKRTPMRP